MSKFDTHGGYFAPKDYLKVNEGGSHEENPNGGVQIGVDPEGTPNLLEEGEPVYKDYVYSDNISAEKEFLEQNHLPSKYDGKLYSKIADDILSEAEERPLDPISRNGLEALLGRLADAQEGQKQAQQQRELEDELANLSPEELDQLEQMLSQEQLAGTDNPMYGEGPIGAQGEPGIPPEQMMGPAEPIPMMSDGGILLRRFDMGGPKKSMADEVKDEILRQAEYDGRASGVGNTDYPLIDEHPELDIALIAAQPGTILEKALAPSAYRGIVSGIADGEPVYALTSPFKYTATTATADEIAHGVGELWDKVRQYEPELKKLEKDLAAAKKARRALRFGKGSSSEIANADAEIKRIEYNIKSVRPAHEEALRHAREFNPVESTGKTINSTKTEAPLEPESSPKPAESSSPEQFNRWKSGLYGAATGASMAGGYALGNYLYNGLQDYKAADDFSDIGSDLDDIFSSTKTDKKESSDLISLKYGGPMKKFVGGGDIDEPIDPNELISSPANGWSFWMPTTPVYNVPGFRAPVQRMDEYLYDKYGFNLTSPLISSGNPAPSPSAPSALSSTIPYNRSLNGEDFEAQEYYKNFLAHMLGIRDSEEANQWMQYIQDEIAKRNSNYQLKGFDDWYRLATDKKVGPVHQATEAVANELARRRQMRADKIAYEDAFKDVKAPNAVDQNAIGLGPWGNAMGAVAPAQALAAREMAKRAGALSATGFLAPIDGKYYGDKTEQPAITSASTVSNPDTLYGGEIELARVAGENEEEQTSGLLPTWPRYAGAVGSGLLGLYNVFQQPDKYRVQRLNPATPQGRIHLQNQVYNPLDQNMVANAIAAQGNATNRALRNSGLGPSSAAAILAADNNTTGNLGTGFLQTWDANNQRRNAVIAANNQAEAQRAQFDYTVDAARAQALNDAAIRNAQNDLLIQRLNNMAEGEKYQAISNQISNGLQALSGIGKENFAMNQINTNPAFLGYGVGANGGMYYNPRTGKYERIEPVSQPVAPKSTAAVQTPVLKRYPRDYQLELLNNPTLYPGYDMTLNGLKKKNR